MEKQQARWFVASFDWNGDLTAAEEDGLYERLAERGYFRVVDIHHLQLPQRTIAGTWEKATWNASDVALELATVMAPITGEPSRIMVAFVSGSGVYPDLSTYLGPINHELFTKEREIYARAKRRSDPREHGVEIVPERDS